MGLFSRALVDEYTAEWQFECYEKLIQNFSREPALADTELWRPGLQDFNAQTEAGNYLQGEALAEFTFGRIKAQTGFDAGADFKLVAVETPGQHELGGIAVLQTDQQACGTYQIVKRGAGYVETIHYDLRLTQDPENLVATLAHEIGHALHNRARTDLDIEPELYEMFTDLTAIYLGYGIFTANSRFEYSQFQSASTQGWQMRASGYLSESEIIFALAIFLRVKNQSDEEAVSFLKPRLAKLLKKANRQLEAYGQDIERLKKLQPLA